MALFTESEVRNRARTRFRKSAATIITEHLEPEKTIGHYDIFLSHAYDDRELVRGTSLMIEDLGYSVYIDWREDSYLDRSLVSPNTADRLRIRLKSCKCLFYSTTTGAADSVWMPWELGFKDGENTRVAVLPIAQHVISRYRGREYLGMYPYVAIANDKKGTKRLWIFSNPHCYISFDSWLKGKEPRERS